MNDWVLHHGDFRDGIASIPDSSVGVVITDPPYSQHVHAAQRRGHTGYEEQQSSSRATFNRSRELGFEHLTPEMRASSATHFARIAQRWVLVFTDHEGSQEWKNDLEASGLEVVRFGVWIKVGATRQFTGDRPAVGHEVIVIAHPAGRKRWNGGGRHAVWTYPIVLDRGANGARLHTTQKPLALMEALVRDFTDPEELILDPFAGSGTTGVAALRLGRRFVGWEMDEKYHAVASKRLDRAREQMEMNV